MSLKEYNELNIEIQLIYSSICMPCMKLPTFRKGDCKPCPTMKLYIELQQKKKELEEK